MLIKSQLEAVAVLRGAYAPPNHQRWWTACYAYVIYMAMCQSASYVGTIRRPRDGYKDILNR